MTTSSAKTFTPKELIEHIPETTDPFWHNVAVEHMNKLATAHPSPKTAAD